MRQTERLSLPHELILLSEYECHLPSSGLGVVSYGLFAARGHVLRDHACGTHADPSAYATALRCAGFPLLREVW